MAFILDNGKRFGDLPSLEKAIKKYESDSFTVLSKADSHKFGSATVKKKLGDRPFKPELVYVDIKYVCHHSGTFKSKSGKRSGTTAKTGCKLFVAFKV